MDDLILTILSQSWICLMSYSYYMSTLGNMSKEIDVIEDALKYIREMRDTWKEVMKKAAGAK